ncbi:hypothetical protein [Sporisorium scitamineum]|uniref:Uncharacterized protein n=1 Tax=Sporisorium scitamineum TaxID=49012 RepID=A0A0F7S2J3_9BASI|nr:hypothetical protein [Sporisorium scitamineum]
MNGASSWTGMDNGICCFRSIFLLQLCKLENTSSKVSPITVKSADPGVTTPLSVWDSSNGTAIDIGCVEDGARPEKLRGQDDKLKSRRSQRQPLPPSPLPPHTPVPGQP